MRLICRQCTPKSCRRLPFERTQSFSSCPNPSAHQPTRQKKKEKKELRASGCPKRATVKPRRSGVNFSVNSLDFIVFRSVQEVLSLFGDLLPVLWAVVCQVLYFEQVHFQSHAHFAEGLRVNHNQRLRVLTRRLKLFGGLRDEVAEVAGGVDAVVLCFHYEEESHTELQSCKYFFSEKELRDSGWLKVATLKKKPRRSGVIFFLTFQSTFKRPSLSASSVSRVHSS